MKPEEIDYEMLFSTMVIKDEWQAPVRAQAKLIASKKERYELAISKINTAMPWPFIAIVHYMECNSNFNTHLHNGDSLRERTVHVPAGRPLADPMNGKGAAYTWIESAKDAMHLKGFDTMQSWSLKEILYRLESYNGFGYELYYNIYSPYLWSGTNHYEKGKYESDGLFNRDLVSKQIGAAPLFRYLTDKTLNVV